MRGGADGDARTRLPLINLQRIDRSTSSAAMTVQPYLRDKFMHNPQRTPHEAFIARTALIAELVQETVRARARGAMRRSAQSVAARGRTWAAFTDLAATPSRELRRALL